jgi:large subunit ribosomal protein L25
MEQLTLNAEIRPAGTKGTLSARRREGLVPGILYGLKSEPMRIQVKASDLRTLLPKRNHVVALQIEGKSEKSMVKQVDRDPIRLDVLHIDFLRVDEVHPVTVAVPVIPEGVPVGVKTQGGVFSVSKKFVKLKAKVHDIPEKFVIDVSGFEQGKTFYVRELQFEKGSILTPGRTAMFGVGTGRKEEELPVAAPAAAAAGAPAAGAAAPAAGAEGKDAKAAAPAGKGDAKGKSK